MDQGKVVFLQRDRVKLDRIFQKLSPYEIGTCDNSLKFACFLARALLLWRLSSLLCLFAVSLSDEPIFCCCQESDRRTAAGHH